MAGGAETPNIAALHAIRQDDAQSFVVILDGS
jgi:hypothetical protein